MGWVERFGKEPLSAVGYSVLACLGVIIYGLAAFDLGARIVAPALAIVLFHVGYVWLILTRPWAPEDDDLFKTGSLRWSGSWAYAGLFSGLITNLTYMFALGFKSIHEDLLERATRVYPDIEKMSGGEYLEALRRWTAPAPPAPDALGFTYLDMPTAVMFVVFPLGLWALLWLALPRSPRVDSSE